MIGNIWISSALIITAMFSASAIYKSYSDIQEAKQIQEHYEIVKEIKNLIAKQYNKNPSEITRAEIIAYLPEGENWKSVLLLDRETLSDLDTKEFIDENGNITISEDETLKLLALKAKLQSDMDTSKVTVEDKKYTYNIGNKNLVNDEEYVEKEAERFAILMQTISGASANMSILDSVIPLEHIEGKTEAIKKKVFIEKALEKLKELNNYSYIEIKNKSFIKNIIKAGEANE